LREASLHIIESYNLTIIVNPYDNGAPGARVRERDIDGIKQSLREDETLPAAKSDDLATIVNPVGCRITGEIQRREHALL
jgi:hypothetical protein